jgi:hypothetical protein
MTTWMPFGLAARSAAVVAIAAVLQAVGGTEAVAQQPQGGNPAALVEDVKAAGTAGIEFMDFVYPGQSIPLGAQGQLVLGYFSSCRVETIRGGTVTIGTAESRVSGGQVRATNRPCDPKRFAATTQTAEAGAAVKRVTPFDARQWAETSLKSDRPVFRWRDKGQATVRVMETGQPTPQLVWTANGSKGYVEYPGRPALRAGVLYVVEVTGAGSTKRAAFSIDPDLEIGDGLLNRTVDVSR